MLGIMNVRYNVILATATIFSVILVDIHLYVLDEGLPPLQYRCSAKYPEFSIVLDLWVTLPDGSLQVSDGTVYPPGASWESGGVVRGCPCTIRVCSMKYCTRMENVKFQTKLTHAPRSTFPPFIREIIYHGQLPAPDVEYHPTVSEKTNDTVEYKEENNDTIGQSETEDYTYLNNSIIETEHDYSDEYYSEHDHYEKSEISKKEESLSYEIDYLFYVDDDDKESILNYSITGNNRGIADENIKLVINRTYGGDYEKENKIDENRGEIVFKVEDKGGETHHEMENREGIDYNIEENGDDEDDDFNVDTNLIDAYGITISLEKLFMQITRVNFGVRRREFLSLVPQCESTVSDYLKTSQYNENVYHLNYTGILNICYQTGDEAFLNSFTCNRHDWFNERVIVNRTLLQKRWRIQFVILAFIIHVVTLLLFYTVPHLHTINNKNINCYLLAQILRKSAMIVRYFVKISEDFKGFDVFIFGVSYYGSLSSKFWQLAIAHSLWMVFRCQRVSINNKSFIIYSAFSWTVPLICSLSIVLWVDSEDEAEISHIGSFAVFAPGLMAEVCCMVLCGLTVWRMKVWREGKELRGEDSQRHNAREVRWSILLVKVILLDVGLEYIIFTVLAMARLRYYWSGQEFPLSPIWYKIPDDFNNLRGVQIFFFFVLKMDVWKDINQRWTIFYKLPNFTKSTPKSTSRIVDSA